MGEIIKKWQKTKAYKKVHKFSTETLKFLKVVIFISLAYSATVMYSFGFKLTAGGIAAILGFYIIFSWLDALSKG